MIGTVQRDEALWVASRLEEASGVFYANDFIYWRMENQEGASHWGSVQTSGMVTWYRPAPR